MQSDGGITINFPTVDWATLIPQLVGYFFDGIGKWMDDTLHESFDGLWGSGANVVGNTDLAMTWGFGPVHDQVVSIQTGARAILLFALILLGLKSMLGAFIERYKDTFGDFVSHVLMSVVMVAAFPLLVPLVIDLVNQAAHAVGTADIGKYVNAGGIHNAMVQGVLFIILLFFAIRLLLKAVWRIGFLAVMLPVGMLACGLYAVPQTRWILTWWARMWGGMLVAQIPSVMALSIGAQLFAGGGGIGAFVYSIAFLQLATDLYSLIPFGNIGHHSDPISSAAAGLRTTAAVVGLGAGILPGAAAAQGAALTNQRVQRTVDYGY